MAISKTMKTVLWIAIPVVVIGGVAAIWHFNKDTKTSGDKVSKEGGGDAGKFVYTGSTDHRKPVGHVGADLHQKENINKA